MKNNFFCIVGFGNHAKNKILPSIKKIKDSIITVVSKHHKSDGTYYVYNLLDDAIKNAQAGTIFIVCSSPDNHFKESKKILKAGFSLFIEKPIVIEANELNSLIKCCSNKNLFFVENFMYKYSLMYQCFIDYWLVNKDTLSEIIINFTIPELPKDTFRQQISDYSINLYDIGCYPISLISELDDKAKFTLSQVINKNKIDHEIFIISSMLDHIKVSIKFGVTNEYKNNVKLIDKYNNKVTFEHFFYGREGERKIIKMIRGDIKSETIKDIDCFKVMFSNPFEYWFKNQHERNINMKNNLSILENLSKQYKGM